MLERTSQRIIRALIVIIPVSLILFGTCGYVMGPWVWDRYIARSKDIIDLTTTDGKVFEGTGLLLNRRDRGSIMLYPRSMPDGVSRESLDHNAASFTLEIEQLDGSGNVSDTTSYETPGNMVFKVMYGCFPKSRQRVKAVVTFREPVPKGLRISLICYYPWDLP